MTEPLRVDIEVACASVDAFSIWTERFGDWWPRGHSVTGDPAAVCFEPRLHGRIFERTRDGLEIDWGEITEWDPPRRLAYLWHIRRDRADATDVEISFIAVGNDATRVEITHTGWERLGAEAERWRDANRGGWAGLLPNFIAACEAHGIERGGTT
jgi:uncharacterized protein YndB with AHSA1/START domain